MGILWGVIIGGLLALLISNLYVYYIHGHEKRIAIISLATSVGGIVGGAIAWWLTG